MDPRSNAPRGRFTALALAAAALCFPVFSAAQRRPPRALAARPVARPPAAPRVCWSRSVELRRADGHGGWTGPLTDCAGRPSARALAALSLLASPAHGTALPPALLLPALRAIRRAAPAAGWDLADEAPPPARAACPPGREPAPALTPRAPPAARATRTVRPRTRATPPACRPIELPRDVATHDALLTLEGGGRVLAPRLVAMLARIAERFPGRALEVVSGYRPSRDPHSGSRHAHARALDFRVDGASREALRDFARTLPDAGVGYYPHSVFVHLDVRDRDEGSARWTDYSAPGETPRYGHWPPRDTDLSREVEYFAGRAAAALDALRAAEDSAPPAP